MVNLGVPGLSSTQVRNRLPVWLSRYQPDVVVAWSGVNDSWNVSEVDDRRAAASRSRSSSSRSARGS